MAEPLFVYGTLRDPDILAAVLARPLNADALHAAVAPGFRAVPYPGRSYPALLRAPGGSAPGLVLTDLTPFERDLLDAYEADEYQRTLIPVMIGEELHEAFAYLPTAPIPPASPDWTLEAWQQDHKARALPAERLAARQLREKLIAVRPN